VSPLDTELQPGDEIAGFRVTGVAGRGGMGVVYRAEQLDLQRPVALKLIATPLARDEDFRERFVRESRAAAAIDHPNVIPVYSAGEEQGRLYLAMRYVDGEDLRTLVHRDGPLEPHRAASVIAQVANALDAAHARGLVHRDIKPANVLLDGDHAYLTDFGLTKRLTGETTMTGSGRWVGTLGYIAPEQIRGEGVDARADVYALGCLLFYVLTGVAPYRRDSDEATLYAHLHDAPPDARALEPDVPEALARVVERALAKDPDDRYPSAGDLGRAALAAVGNGPAPPPERTVARGAAAPGGHADDETVVPGAHPPAATAATATAPTALGAGDQHPRPTSRGGLPPWLTPVLSLLAGAAVVLIVVLLATRGGDDENAAGPGATTGTQTTRTTAAGGAIKTKDFPVDPRPNAIAYAANRVWVGSPRTNRLIGLPASGSGERRVIRLPWNGGTTSIAAGFGSLWVTNGAQGRLVRIDPKSGHVQGNVLVGEGQAVVVAVGEGAVWVGRRAEKSTDPPSAVVKVDPHGGPSKQIPFGEEGISDITTGGDYVWVANRRRAKVSRLAPRTGDRKSAAVGRGVHRVAYSDGQVWVTNYDDGTLTQNTRALDNKADLPLDVRGPQDVIASNGSLWVVSNLDDQVVRVDPKTAERVGDPIDVGRNPFRIAAHGKRLWVTNLAGGSVTQLTLP
jgi:streptogramin lyase/predicted Ser/Thr protein kinase